MSAAQAEDPRPFREIRAFHDRQFVRVYQAYNDQIADLAVTANSFAAPRDAGLWSPTRMTWIKPSAVWMAYRCGWGTMKDRNQARVLALDLSRPLFEEVLASAMLSTHGDENKACKNSEVVVQWDPERAMDPSAPASQCFTRKLPAVRSVQIGMRGRAGGELMCDPSFVLRVTDVTETFRAAAAALQAGDVGAAGGELWPRGVEERPMELPAELRSVLCMDQEAQSVDVRRGVPPSSDAGEPRG